MQMTSSMVRLSLCIMLCVPAQFAQAVDLKAATKAAEKVEGIASYTQNAASTSSLEMAWSGAASPFEGLRDALSAMPSGPRVAVAGAGLTVAGAGRTPVPLRSASTRGFHASVPPVPASGRVTLQAADEGKKDEKKDKKEDAPPPDPKAVTGAAMGMAVGALIGLLLGGPIGLCIGIMVGALAGALAGKMTPDAPKPEAAPAK